VEDLEALVAVASVVEAQAEAGKNSENSFTNIYSSVF
jgi:hypothetical protein